MLGRIEVKNMNAEQNGFERKPSAALAIFWGGLLCGVLDIAYAFALYGARGVDPARLLRGIASGLLGPAALRGGLAISALGLFLHFVIAYGAATVYYMASRKLHFMVRQAVLAGMLYGVAVHLFMNFVVIPLSAIGPRPINLAIFVVNAFEHMLLVGLPISLAVRRYSETLPNSSVHKFQQAGPRAASA